MKKTCPACPKGFEEGIADVYESAPKTPGKFFMKKFLVLFFGFYAFFLFFGREAAMALELKSSAFASGDKIPAQFTCAGTDVSVDLSWGGLPQGTKSLALICDDPDAPMGTWVHWVICNIPPEKDGLARGIDTQENLKDGMRQGLNDFGNFGYGGPCPPSGKPHRYYFKLYALDIIIPILKGSLTKEKLLQAMQGHILAEATLMGIYQR